MRTMGLSWVVSAASAGSEICDLPHGADLHGGERAQGGRERNHRSG